MEHGNRDRDRASYLIKNWGKYDPIFPDAEALAQLWATFNRLMSDALSVCRMRKTIPHRKQMVRSKFRRPYSIATVGKTTILSDKTLFPPPRLRHIILWSVSP